MPHSLSLGKLKTVKHQQWHRKTHIASTEVSYIKLGHLFKSIRHHRLKGKVAVEQQAISAPPPYPETCISLSPPPRQPLYDWNTDHPGLLPGINNARIFSESASWSTTADQSIAPSEESPRSLFHTRSSKSTSALLPKTPIDPFADSVGASSALISSPTMFNLRSHSAGDYIVRQLGTTLEKLSLSESQYTKLEEDILPIKSLNTQCNAPKSILTVTSSSQGSPTSSDMIVSPAPHCLPTFNDSLASGYLVNLKQQLQENRWLCKFARSRPAKAHVAVAPTIFITPVDTKHPEPPHSPVGLYGLANSPCPDDPFNADPFASGYSHPSQYDLPLLPSTPNSEETGEVTDPARYLPGTLSDAHLELFPSDGEEFATALSATITNPFDLPPFSIPFMKPDLLGASFYDH